MLKTTTLLFVLLLLLSGSRCTSHKEEVEPVKESSCFEGKWGNDYLLCGPENSGRPGRGSLAKRKEEELWLTFSADNKGVFHFYDCQNKTRFRDGIPFVYTLNGNQITFQWQGDTEEVHTYGAIFHFRDTFQYECRNDTLFFTDGLMKNTMYNGASYFVRRE
ncbi:hypothetical protein [Telluribacter sp. SYSU D00476]|uniref:hypothetical protein n=1 Tax=Telluribacter sp. SYSU D00476 TaxID=2811430 RepID=UPI001FF3EF1F|nr:hypothetical protein [Telluribacter sp. SYSU D00476]